MIIAKRISLQRTAWVGECTDPFSKGYDVSFDYRWFNIGPYTFDVISNITCRDKRRPLGPRTVLAPLRLLTSQAQS